MEWRGWRLGAKKWKGAPSGRCWETFAARYCFAFIFPDEFKKY